MRTFLTSERSPWGVLDTWLNRGCPLAVFTVLADHARGEGWLAEVKGDHQGVWGLAVVDQVSGQPADRLREALDQSKRRQGKALGDATPAGQRRPLPGAARKRVTAAPDDRDIGASRNVMQNHQLEMRPVPRYAQDRQGQGRWVQIGRAHV